jgi:RNA polymerase sigma-70 factor (ECF subfamily)
LRVKDDDDDIIAAVRAGERKAGDLLARRYYQKLSAYYRKRLPPEDAEDLTQATLMETVARIDRFRGESSFHHYAFSIARRVLAESERRRGRRISTEPAPTSEPPGYQTPPHERVARTELLELIDEAVQGLEEHYKSVLLLKLSGATNFEIAENLDLHYNTVRSRLSRAKAAVRERLQAFFDEFFGVVPPGLMEQSS